MLFATPPLDERMAQVLDRIGDLRRRLGSMLREPRRWHGLMRRNAQAEALRGSNTIEGIRITEDDALAAVAGESPLEADARTWAEIQGYRRAMTWVLQLARDPGFTHSTHVLRGLHFMMLEHDMARGPGQWRPGYVQVVDSSSGAVVYEGAEAAEVPGLMDELVATLEPGAGDDPIPCAAMAHLNLVMVHPFRDGNGRMARCLQSLVLARAGLLSPEFMSIEEYLGRHTREYYAVLARVGGGQWQPGRSAVEWLRFCLTAHLQQAALVLDRQEHMRRTWDALERLLAARGLPERTAFALADALDGRRVRNHTYRQAADIALLTASRDLRLLVQAGLLEPRGEKRGRTYRASGDLLTLRQELPPPARVVADPFEEH
jgi:Fic family protein